MAQLNDLLVMGQSTLLGPVKIDSIIDKNGSNGATNSTTIDKVLKSDDNGKLYWGSVDNVSVLRNLTAGTKIATITINGTDTDLFCQTNTNTTYTFAGGTNEFTVTPSGGSTQTVSVTPSITNNITGTGANGYLAKFNGTNTITHGPQLGSSKTTFLRNDGQWATPSIYVDSILYYHQITSSGIDWAPYTNEIYLIVAATSSSVVTRYSYIMSTPSNSIDRLVLQSTTYGNTYSRFGYYYTNSTGQTSTGKLCFYNNGSATTAYNVTIYRIKCNKST